MSDNSTQGGADLIRDLARLGGAVKTQVVQLDIGGPASNPEMLVAAGQKTAAASVPVVIASDQSAILVASRPAANSWGQSLALTNGATAAAVSVPSSAAGYQLCGLVGHGVGDGYFAVQVNSVTVFSGRTRSTLPTLILVLPNGMPVPAGSLVALKVTNESGSTADFEATLLGAYG